jgi:protein-export membrane protein SecD
MANMKRIGKPTFFILAVLIFAFTYAAFFGVYNYFGDRKDVTFKGTSEIRWGIDIQGGVEAVFAPDIGITLDNAAADGGFQVTAVDTNMSQKYGVLANDLITHVGGVDVSSLGYEEAVKRLRLDGAGDSCAFTVRRGGEEINFSIPKISAEQIKNAQTVLELRLVGQSITDYEIYTDTANRQVIVRFPWKSGEEEFDPSAAISELGNMAVLTFREGTTADGTVILEGDKHVDSAKAQPDTENGGYEVSLVLKGDGPSLFAGATARLAGNGNIAICMDSEVISAPSVNTAINDGRAVITGNFTVEEAEQLAANINAGSLPFKLSADSSALKIIDPTFGANALNTMLLAGLVAFGLVCLFMIVMYRLPGMVACISLLGQIGGMIACVSGFFSVFESFTLTIPGIAGIILSIGMGVDANVITSERIKEELATGKTLNGAIDAGYEGGFSAIFDGNMTVVIVSLLLMGAFGPPDKFPGWLIKPLLFFFPASITGTIYSFGFTLLTGVIFNMIMGVYFSRWMTKSLSKFKALRRPFLYGGAKNV